MERESVVLPAAGAVGLEVPTLAQIKTLEAEMQALPQLPIEIRHEFAEGTYARTMDAPANALIVGKTHKHSCVNIISEGSIIVWTENDVKRIDAPCVFVSPPGVKRVGFTLKRTIWTTVHTNPTNTKNLELLEAAIIEREALNPPPRNPEIATRVQNIESKT